MLVDNNERAHHESHPQTTEQARSHANSAESHAHGTIDAFLQAICSPERDPETMLVASVESSLVIKTAYA